ncbi:MAG: hypothetical protein COV48_07000 [Elusimicrobia bacterium CG11_big_fil_rev_8_21_14_0_20_64_6]|nr:MAG: hypothetical protein COV48_07000 [Elusimicrobia bacterium CG11_big_fil_rev_8_21_14_0_20_64_6]
MLKIAWPCFLLFALAGCARQRFESRLERMRAIAGSYELSDFEKSRELLRDSEIFRADEFLSTRLSRLNDAQLKKLFGTLGHIALYIEDSPPVYPMEQVFNEMTIRKIESPSDAEDMFKQYLVAHLFDKAREFMRAHAIPGSPAVPETVKMALPSSATSRAFSVSDDAKTIELESLPMDKGPRVVMTVGPLCNPSGRANAAIEADPVLKQLMGNYAVRIAEPGEMQYLHKISEWNRAHPGSKMHVAYRPGDWPEMNLGETPIFYFLENGKVTHTVTGWPSDEQKHELMKGFAVIGVTAPKRSAP